LSISSSTASASASPNRASRPLKRAIQHLLLDPLSLDVLDGKFVDGDVITADVKDGRVAFLKE
jgi:ATP-dependent Clp protease ATP-binding subunit ClpB